MRIYLFGGEGTQSRADFAVGVDELVFGKNVKSHELFMTKTGKKKYLSSRSLIIFAAEEIYQGWNVSPNGTGANSTIMSICGTQPLLLATLLGNLARF